MFLLPRSIEHYAPFVTLLLALAALAPSYWSALHMPAVGLYHDDSLYIVTARALAEGRGYSIESLPTPMPQTKYPILFPALLALVWKIAPAFPANLILFKMVPLLAALAWFGLSFLLIQRASGSAWLAAAAVALTASSPHAIFLSTTVRSETLFAALFTACLLFSLDHDRRGSPLSLIAAAILAAAAYHTRTIGLCLILAGCLALLLRRRRRQAMIFAGVCAVLASPWILWQTLNPATDPYLSHQNYYTGYNIVLNFSWPDKFRIAFKNLVFLPFAVQSLFDLSWGGVIGLVSLPFALRGLFNQDFPRTARYFLLLSGLVILLWVWPPLRFLVPLLPLLLWSVWAGAPGRLRNAVLAAAWLLAAHGLTVSRTISSNAVERGFWRPGETETTEWKNFKRQLDWIQAHTSPGAIFQSNLDPTVFLFTGRRAIRGSHGNASLSWYLDNPQPLGDAAQFRDTLIRNNVSYLLDSPCTWFFETKFFTRLIDENIRVQAGSLQLQDQSPDGRFRIYRFTPSALSTDDFAE